MPGATLGLTLAFALLAPAGVEGTLRVLEVRLPGTTLSLELVRLPARTPTSDGPVPLDSVWMSRTEVTWDLYDAFVFGLAEPQPSAVQVDASSRPSKPYIPVDRGFGHTGHPVISVSYKGAEAFCVWLSAKTGREFRLPSTAEWEYACRAGTSGRWSFGDDVAQLDEHAWFRANAERRTHTVATKAANPFGLHDLLGNVAEWCTDAQDGPIVCGSSYLDPEDEVHASRRRKPTRAWNRSDPQIPKSMWWLADGGFIGFRVVSEANQSAQAAAEPRGSSSKRGE